MKRYLIHLGFTALGGLVVAAIVVLGGLAPIKASSGHWSITRWLLDFSKTRSVATSSVNVTLAPNLDQASMIHRGGGTYELNCAWCHGSPLLEQPRVMAAATPSPPNLMQRLSRYEAEELFTIVQHGIKFTGMPGWPARHREDEAWSMVAFLQAYPELTPDRYRELAFGDAETDTEFSAGTGIGPDDALATCVNCHGMDGNGRGNGAFPIIGGQREAYLAASLKAYRDGDRASGIMEPIAQRLSDAQIETLSRHYAGQSWEKSPATPATSSQSETDDSERVGQELAEYGDRAKKIPSCLGCHQPGSSANPNYPIIDGQHQNYLARQLRLFRANDRGGSSYSHLMEPASSQLTDSQIESLADYFSQASR